MLDAEKGFDEVREWPDTRLKDFIPVWNLRDKLKKALSELEKQEIYKREEREDWFHKKCELELALEAKKRPHGKWLNYKQLNCVTEAFYHTIKNGLKRLAQILESVCCGSWYGTLNFLRYVTSITCLN